MPKSTHIKFDDEDFAFMKEFRKEYSVTIQEFVTKATKAKIQQLKSIQENDTTKPEAANA